jgi:hypothetical protein
VTPTASTTNSPPSTVPTIACHRFMRILPALLIEGFEGGVKPRVGDDSPRQ